MNKFFRTGSTYNVITQAAFSGEDQLPAGNYVVSFNDTRNTFHLEVAPDFTLPSKLYGTTPRDVERILNTYLARGCNTGVMLTGEKGSGKTQLSRALAVEAARLHGMPCIIVNRPFGGDTFNAFLASIEQRAMVFFDEFEKVYDSDAQPQLLTLLDGTADSNKLFVLTCNDRYRVDHHMHNRPGRIFYMIEFKGLEPDFIQEYCNDNLKNKQHIDAICKLSNLFSAFNFDMLKALVEEMNRYDEKPIEALRLLNVKPKSSESDTFDVAFRPSKPMPKLDLDQSIWAGSPLGERPICISGWHEDPKDADDTKHFQVMFSANHFTGIDASNGRFFFRDPEGNELTLTRKKQASFDYELAF